MSKAGTRRKSRELALQMLFQLDMGHQDLEQVRKTFWSERQDLDEKVREFSDELFRVACQRRECPRRSGGGRNEAGHRRVRRKGPGQKPRLPLAPSEARFPR